jgi:hypothetical protein
MFDIRSEFFCISQIIKNPYFDWENSDDTNEVHISEYLKVFSEVTEVIYKNTVIKMK